MYVCKRLSLIRSTICIDVEENYRKPTTVVVLPIFHHNLLHISHSLSILYGPVQCSPDNTISSYYNNNPCESIAQPSLHFLITSHATCFATIDIMMSITSMGLCMVSSYEIFIRNPEDLRILYHITRIDFYYPI